MARRDKNVAILFNKPGVFPGLEEVVSAHIQLPAFTSSLLCQEEIQNVVVSTELPENQVLPNILRDMQDGSLLLVPDPNKQGTRSVVIEGQIKGVNPLKLAKYVFSVSAILFKKKIKVLHVFGTEKFALLSILFRLALPWLRIVWTTETFNSTSSWLKKQLLAKGISRILTTTEFVKSKYDFCPDVRVAGRGIVRQFQLASGTEKNRVLFWRDPSWENGADIALAVFKKLAARYPSIRFTFAVRNHWDPVVTPEDCADFQNLEMHAFPYENGVTIEGLLSETICVLFPFRELSTNPQLAVVETLFAEVPVVCSSVESNAEVIRQVGMDYGLTDDVDEYAEKLSELLDDYLERGEIRRPDRQQMKTAFDWKSYVDACIDSYQ